MSPSFPLGRGRPILSRPARRVDGRSTRVGQTGAAAPAPFLERPSMRNLILRALAATALLAAVSAVETAQAAPNAQLLSGVYTSDQPAALVPAQFIFGGRNYCWYDNGWRGAGYYWCGYASRNGLGWGGGSGWNGWQGHGGSGGGARLSRSSARGGTRSHSGRTGGAHAGGGHAGGRAHASAGHAGGGHAAGGHAGGDKR